MVCVDDNLGMAFNHRRQSQDRVLRRKMLERTAGRPLWMSPYSCLLYTSDAADEL